MRLAFRRSKTFFVQVLLFALLQLAAFAKTDWAPIPAEDLAATECKSFPGSSAEALLIQQTFDSSPSDSWTTQHKRIKIYSPKGAEERGVMNIEYSEDQKVWDLLARVTKQDGRAIEYKNSDFHDGVYLKVDRYKLKRKILAVPNLDAGDIVELKWSQSAATNVGNYYWWYCQLNIPVRHYAFAMMGSQADYRIMTFNAPGAKLEKTGDHTMRLDIYNLAPFEEEPDLAPMRDVRGWFQVLFTSSYLRWFSKEESSWWKEISAYFAEEYRDLTKPSATIKKTANEIIKGAATDEEKIKRLYDFTQQHVSNFDYFVSADLQKAKQKIDDSRHPQIPDETLKLRSGYSHHVNELFASLARAAGFDLRQAKSANKNTTLQVKNSSGWIYLNDDMVAIRQGQTWSMYAPGDYYTPVGMIDQSNELAPVLICDDKQVIFEKIPVSPPGKSLETRRGRFTLDAEGNLEGEIDVSMEGHTGMAKQKAWHAKLSADIDADYRRKLTEYMPTAEVGELTWKNIEGNSLPLSVHYKVKVPGYADLAGSKIIVAPNFFEHGKQARFSAETRQYPIFFAHAWSEQDDIEIILPEGYTLDAGSAPANVGDPSGALGVRYGVGYKPKSRTLAYKRDFTLGANGATALQAASYPPLKALFESIHLSDEHTIVLKPKPTVAATPTASTPPQVSDSRK